MVKQLGIPTWFMTLSCADLRWPELFQIVARTQGKNLTDEQVQALSYVERCQMLTLLLLQSIFNTELKHFLVRYFSVILIP